MAELISLWFMTHFALVLTMPLKFFTSSMFEQSWRRIYLLKQCVQGIKPYKPKDKNSSPLYIQ